MASLNLGQDVSNKREKIDIAGPIVAKSYPLYQDRNVSSLRFSY